MHLAQQRALGNLAGRTALLRVELLLAAFSLLLLNGLNFAEGQGTVGNVIPAYLNGSSQVPPNNSHHTGHGSFRYSYGDTQVHASVTCPLPFAPLAAKIHGPGSPNHNAPLAFDLGPFALVTNIVTVVGWPTNYTYTNIAMICSNTVNFSAQQIADLEQGLYYLNITSFEYPQGEIRGQISRSAIVSNPKLRNAKGFSFDVTAPVEPFQPFDIAIEYSINLIHWSALTNVTIRTNHLFEVSVHEFIPPGVTIEVTDPKTTKPDNRFYRVMGR